MTRTAFDRSPGSTSLRMQPPGEVPLPAVPHHPASRFKRWRCTGHGFAGTVGVGTGHFKRWTCTGHGNFKITGTSAAPFKRWTCTGTATHVPTVFDPLTSVGGWEGYWLETRTATQWTDESGNGRHLTEATNPPSFGPTLNGHVTWAFDGTNDVLRRATPISTFITDSAFTCYALVRADSFDFVGNNRTIWSSTGSGWEGLVAASSSGNKFKLFAYSGGVLKEIVAEGNVNGWYLIELRHESGTNYLRVNNGPEVSIGCGAWQDITQNICVGVNSADSVFFQGGMGWLAFHKTALSSVNRQAIRDWAIDRWALDKPIGIFGTALQLWLRADQGVTLNGGNVSAWADQSGAGNNFAQAVGGRQVPFDATGLGGKPCLTFDGSTAAYLEMNLSTYLNMLPSTGHAFYAVLQPANTEADANSWIEPAVFTDSSGNAAVCTSTLSALRSSHWGGSSDNSTMVPAAAGVTCFFRRRFSGSAIFAAKNAGPNLTVAATTMSATGGNALLGINYGTTAKYHGKIGEIICVNRDITPAEDAAMALYLNSFWAAALPAAPTPALVSSAVAWWRADNAHNDGSGKCDSLVPRFDSVGGGDANKTLTQATSGNRPTITATDSDFNNLPSLSFGTNGALVSGTLGTPLSDPCWVFAIAKATGDQYVCDDLASGHRHSLFSSSGSLRGYETGYSFGSGATWSGTAALVFVYDDTSGVSYVSSMTAGDQHGIGSTGTMTGLTLGNYLGGGSGGVKIADFVMGTGVITLDDVYKLMTYARDRYGLTIAP